jgi:hypothetical protein
MRRFFGMVATMGALALAGAATGAYAQTVQTKAAATSQGYDLNGAWTPAAKAHSLQWNGKGRWGLKLDYQQPTSRDVQWHDVDLGIAFKPSSRVRFGAAINVGPSADQPRMVTPDEKPQPRVRLETLFRY